jgi:hypothetical protein
MIRVRQCSHVTLSIAQLYEMSRQTAIDYCKDCWDAYKRLNIDDWRSYAKSMAVTESDMWKMQAMAWMEMTFAHCRARGM